MLTALTMEVGKFKREVAALKKQPKPSAAAEKSEKPTRVGLRRAARQRQEVQALRVASARTAANVVYQEKFGEFGKGLLCGGLV